MSNRLIYPILLIMCYLAGFQAFACPGAEAEAWGGVDSSADAPGASRVGVEAYSNEKVDSVNPAVDYRWYATTAMGAVIVAEGVLSRPDGNFVASPTDRSVGRGLVDVVELSPALIPWAVKAAGGATRSGWGRMGVSQGVGFAIGLGSMELTKRSVNERRPDGSDDRSFPSGHSTIAYMGASMVTHELAWRSPWYSFGAYTAAGAVGLQRVISRRHYPADVATGAGIGIIATQVGYLAGDLIFGTRQLDPRYAVQVPARAGDIGSWLAVTSGLSFSLGDIDFGTATTLHRLPAFFTRFDGAVAVSRHWSIGGEAGITATPIEQRTQGATMGTVRPTPLTELALGITPVYRIAPCSRLLLSARVGGGYIYRPTLHWPDRAISAGRSSAYAVASVSADLPVTEHLAIGLNVGYRLSHYSFRSDLISVSGADHALSLSLSSKILF